MSAVLRDILANQPKADPKRTVADALTTRPKARPERSWFDALADNVIGYDDGVDTPGERLGRGINETAKALYNDPVGTIGGAAKAVEHDLEDLMFHGGAERRPGDVFNYAAGSMAPGALAKAPAGALRSGPARNEGIRAYHGSPHEFDRFSMDKIGTGEGAQAYGHGLYFAENEAVARGYRDALSSGLDGTGLDIRVDGRAIREPSSDQIRAARFGIEPTVEGLQRKIDAARAKLETASTVDELGIGVSDRDMVQMDIDDLQRRINEVRGLDGRIEMAPAGSMYEVRINADPDSFLDWDAPLSEQMGVLEKSPDAMELLRKKHEATARLIEQVSGTTGVPAKSVPFEEALAKKTGADFMDTYTRDLSTTGASLPPERLASEFLRSDGIPGIKYRDAGSRGLDGAEGTRNYVVFDENLIEIVRKYGIAGAATMLGVSASEVEAAMQGGQQAAPGPQ